MQVTQHTLGQEAKPRPEFFNVNPAVVEIGSSQSRTQAPVHRFNLPSKQEDANVRRRVVALKRCRLFSENDPVTVKQAETQEELEAAYRLVHQSYVEAGYLDPHPSGLRVRAFEVLPQTATFIAIENGEVIGTISLIVDSPLGLPMEESYREEVNALRHQGRRIAEVSSLAVTKGSRNLGIFVRLCKYMTLFAISVGVEDLCIGISPEHAPFFKEVYLFETMGEVRSYSSTKEDPVVALRLDLNTFPALCRAAYNGVDADANFYNYMFVYQPEWVKYPQNSKRFCPMTPAMLRYFLVEQTDVLRQASPITFSYLQSCYRHINFHQMLGTTLPRKSIVHWMSSVHEIVSSQGEHLSLPAPRLQSAVSHGQWAMASAA
jgi:hypothetical protein